MKYLWIIFILCFLCGCWVTTNVSREINEEKNSEKEKTTVRETYYLSTIVHDEHLFIISKRHGYFIHHPNCPCLTTKVEEKTEPKPEPPTIILDLIRGNKP